MMSNDAIALAARAAEKLCDTTEDLAMLSETEDFEGCIDNPDFCKALDVMIFMCAECNWWKRQRENATPDAAEWVCQECHGTQ